LFQMLTSDEQRRAERFYFPQDRQHFIAGRGILRVVLGKYLGREPHQLQFDYNLHGKPKLIGEKRLRFNLSHSHGLALYAVTWEREVGVDIEHVRPDFAGEAIAERFFSPNETAVLRSLPDHLRVAAFFNCWTRKEAYIKARGKGLAIPLDQFDVSLAPGEPAALLADRAAPPESQRWAMCCLAPGPGYAGAVAVEGHDWRLWCGHWPDETSSAWPGG